MRLNMGLLALAVLASSLIVASAWDYRRYATRYWDRPTKPNGSGYKYYAVYFYYKEGSYGQKAGDYLKYYVTNYKNNWKSWYGDQAKGIYGYKFGPNPNFLNAGPNSYGGEILFNSYFDAYNYLWNPKYGVYSGYYNKHPQWSYATGFEGAIPGFGSDINLDGAVDPGSDPAATGSTIQGTDTAPVDITTFDFRK